MRRFDPYLVFLLGVFALLALTTSLLVPIFEGPDEDDHFRFAKFIADQRALPVQAFQQGGGEAGHQGWQPPLYYALAALVISPVDTRDFASRLQRNPAQSFEGDLACCGRNLYFHFDAEHFPYARTTLAVHLARGVTILFGLVCVYALYALTLTLFPAQNYLALAATALAAFNPSFLFASALVSNDIPLVAFCTLAFLAMAKILLGQWNSNWKSLTALGTLVALAILTKTTALGLLPIVFLFITYLAWRQSPPRNLSRFAFHVLRFGFYFSLPILVLDAWYFLRNQILYGDPLAYKLIAASALPPRDAPLTLAELTQINLPWLWQTFWGGPTPGDFPQILLTIFLAAFVVALVGFTFHVLRLRNQLGMNRLVMLGLLVAWLAFIFVAQLQFIRTASGTDQGRYLFPALATLALVYALGWSEIVWRIASHVSFRAEREISVSPSELSHAVRHAKHKSFSSAQRVVAIFITAFFIALAAFVLLTYTYPAYAQPAPFNPAALAQYGAPIQADFENGMLLRGYALGSRALACGDKLGVTLFWTTDKRISETYRVFAHLVNAQGTVAGNKDVIPGRGAYPTVYWKPGEWFQDTIFVPLNPGARSGKYTVIVGAYKFGEPDNRVNLKNAENDFVALGDVQVNAPPEGCP